MARITVEDCAERIPNMFQVVLVAAKRARQLANGAHPMVDWENDKPTVVALREIAEGYVGEDILDAARATRRRSAGPQLECRRDARRFAGEAHLDRRLIGQ